MEEVLMGGMVEQIEAALQRIAAPCVRALNLRVLAADPRSVTAAACCAGRR
jgi:hypothetical protein